MPKTGIAQDVRSYRKDLRNPSEMRMYNSLQPAYRAILRQKYCQALEQSLSTFYHRLKYVPYDPREKQVFADIYQKIEDFRTET